MPRLRTPFVVAVLAAAPVLAACQKPTPLVTIFANGQTYHRSAAALKTNGTQHVFDVDIPVIPVTPGTQVGIDVDRSIAHGTWVATIDEGADATGKEVLAPLTPTQTSSHYASFVLPTSTSNGQAPRVGQTYLLLVTVLRGETGRTDDRTGQWAFQLKVAA